MSDLYQIVRKLLITDGIDRHVVILSPREREVLRLVSQGSANKEIGHLLGIELTTVEFHVSEILHGLGVDNRVQAARWAWANEAKYLDGIAADVGFAAFER